MAGSDKSQLQSEFVIECLKHYAEKHGVCPDERLDDIAFWVNFINEELIREGYADNDPQEILDVFLTVFLSRINPVNERTREIAGLVSRYAMKWTHMEIRNDGQPLKVVRPPYVLNGTRLSCTVDYKGDTYSFKIIRGQEMKFSRKGSPDLYVTVKNKDTAEFTVKDTGEKLAPVFKSPGGATISLISIEGFEKESRWHFKDKSKKAGKENVIYVEKGDLIEVNDYLANRYDDANYDGWVRSVKSDLAKCVNGSNKGNYKVYQRAPRDYQHYGGEDVGKAHPDTIVHYLQDYCPSLTDAQMKAILDNNCIGIDCSGFVSRTLAYVMENMADVQADDKNDDTNYRLQIKTVGPISGESNNKVEASALAAKSLKLNTAASFMKLYRNTVDKDGDQGYRTDDEDFNSLELIGSKLLFLFSKGKKNVLACTKINRELNPSDKPEITSLRPGDIVTMGLDEKFKGGFHIAIVCNVGIDLDGPYFITADSSPSTIAESVSSIRKKKKNAMILKRPDSFDPVDISKLGTNQDGSGVRYVLHRDFGFFDVRPFLAFRRPYAFDRYYRYV